MKKLLLYLFVLLSMNILSQTYPIIEDFNTLNGWTVTNGSGIQNNGSDRCLSTNIGTTPYPNSSTITMTSPVRSYTNCLSSLTVTFPLSGIIESNYDYMYFDYYNGSSWVNLGTYTGVINNTYNYPIPNTTTQFRFRLISDCSVNGYKTNGSQCSMSTSYCTPANGNCNGVVNVYYYDICSMTVNCTSVLPIELISFEGNQNNNQIILNWSTATELNNDYFTIEKSLDGQNFKEIGTVKGSGNSVEQKNYVLIDNKPEKGLNYYRLKQTDYNKSFKYSETIDIDFFQDGKYKIYPNPSYSGLFTLDTYPNTEYEVYNKNGSVIYYGLIDKNGKEEFYLDIGSYFIKIKIGNKTYVEQIISK